VPQTASTSPAATTPVICSPVTIAISAATPPDSPSSGAITASEPFLTATR